MEMTRTITLFIFRCARVSIALHKLIVVLNENPVLTECGFYGCVFDVIAYVLIK